MPATHGNNDLWLAQQIKQMKVDIAALKARVAPLAAVSTGLFLPAKVYWAAASGMAFTASAILPFDTVVYDEANAMVVGAAAGFVCPVPGFYWASGQAAVTSTAAGQSCVVSLCVGGAGNFRDNGGSSYAEATGEILQSRTSGILECNASDKIQLGYFGTNGLLGVGGAHINNMTVMRVA